MFPGEGRGQAALPRRSLFEDWTPAFAGERYPQSSTAHPRSSASRRSFP